jgi:hypothetical protein
MFFRQRFITNSSSTGYVAWGVVVPKELLPYDYLPEPEDGIGVHWVSDSERSICIEASVDYTMTDDDDPYLVDEGAYPLKLTENHNGLWGKAECIATVYMRVKEPENYNEWQRKIVAFLQKENIEPKPGNWMLVRSYG